MPIPQKGLRKTRFQNRPRKPLIKRTFLTFATIITGLLVVLNWSPIATGAGGLANKVLLYVHVARLYTMEPDRKLAMPLTEVEKAGIANTWHAARGTNRLHEGQDIFAPQGTPIYSATSGYVLNIGENTLGGQTVSVAGAGGRVYYYAHLNSYAPNLHEGDFVNTRTVLGSVGTTGNAADTPPHLHFGIYAAGGAINPLPLLTDRPKPKKPEPEPQARKKKRQAHTR
ncbi:MAG TPA: M23 family metallopeptidase [Pyrinomonadaceae bacterium]|nr:M23 family metallopeptidase [Pyrinomonadaceae bacterium]